MMTPNTTLKFAIPFLPPSFLVTFPPPHLYPC